MSGTPSDLEIDLEADQNDSTKGNIALWTTQAYSSGGYTVDFELEEEGPADDGSHDGLVKIVYKGINAPPKGSLNITMMSPAGSKIPYEIVDDNGGSIVNGNSLQLEANKTYELVLGDKNSTIGFGEDHYTLEVSDDDVKLEPLATIFGSGDDDEEIVF